jgi:hypothetical protein
VTSAVAILRTDDAAEDSLAAMRARNRFGIATGRDNQMIATTIRSSIKENPAFGAVSELGLFDPFTGMMRTFLANLDRGRSCYLNALNTMVIAWLSLGGDRGLRF